MPGQEPGALSAGRGPEIAFGGARDLAYPAEACLLRVVRGRLTQVESLLDELAVLPKADILMVRETDVGVALIDDVQRLDPGHHLYFTTPRSSAP